MEAVGIIQADDACSAGKSGELLTVNIAAAKAIAAATPVAASETLALDQCSARICAKQVVSALNLPPFANSAMDGYAVKVADLSGDGPWELPVSGRIVAGSASRVVLEQGTAMRIMTGAPVPDGADSVVMQEHCTRTGTAIHISQRPPRGKHIRLAGEDVGCGTVLLNRGDLITPRHIGLLSACGVDTVEVSARLRVGLISTGSELVEPGLPLGMGQIYNSNRSYLRARLDRAWIETVDYGIVADDPAAIRDNVRHAARHCDVVITTGGVSAGEEDHMLDVLRREAAELDVLKVAMRPGKPVTVGRIGGSLYFGLPGNPYACAVTFMQIAWPALCKAGGMEKKENNRFFGISDFIQDHKPGRTEYFPVTWSATDEFGRPIVQLLGKGSSASLHPFARARAIAIISAEVETVEKGDAILLEPVDF